MSVADLEVEASSVWSIVWPREPEGAPIIPEWFLLGHKAAKLVQPSDSRHHKKCCVRKSKQQVVCADCGVGACCDPNGKCKRVWMCHHACEKFLHVPECGNDFKDVFAVWSKEHMQTIENNGKS